MLSNKRNGTNIALSFMVGSIGVVVALIANRIARVLGRIQVCREDARCYRSHTHKMQLGRSNVAN